ncbi:MAG TPA: response regulator [Stellaceae bacterium]|nr:response regulator [Stellaceae bacterium]
MATILVIDDDAAMRRLILRALDAEKHELIEAGDGHEALQLVDQRKPDLIITDILMPRKEGIETMREVAERAPDIKIIAISGGGMSHNLMFLDVAKAFGAAAVIAKPFRASELVETVERVLGEIRRKRAL